MAETRKPTNPYKMVAKDFEGAYISLDSQH